MDGTLAVGIGGLLATVVAILVAYRLGKRAEFALADWFRELRAWASEAIEVLSEAAYTCAGEGAAASKEDVQRRCVYQLSALIDRGRFLLPNQQQTEHGTHKSFAYRGYRHSALGPLVAAVRVLEGTTPVPDRYTVLVELRREFVSDIYRILAPDLHNREIARLVRTSHRLRMRDVTVGGLLPGGAIPRGADALLVEVIARNRADEQASE